MIWKATWIWTLYFNYIEFEEILALFPKRYIFKTCTFNLECQQAFSGANIRVFVTYNNNTLVPFYPSYPPIWWYKDTRHHPIWSFPGGSDDKESTCNAGDLSSLPGMGRSPGEGNGYLLQYSCLQNSTDRKTSMVDYQSIESKRVILYALLSII